MLLPQIGKLLQSPTGVRSACPSSCFELNRSCFACSRQKLKLNPRTDIFIHMGRKRMQLTDGSVLSTVSIQAKALRDTSSLFLSRALDEHQCSSIYSHVVIRNSLLYLFPLPSSQPRELERKKEHFHTTAPRPIAGQNGH